MSHLHYLPGDPRLLDQLVYELKSKGIFDQFRKDCIADVDTRPAYQNLRQRVESSVTTFLSRQVWKPDLNKNQLREKLRKHILDGNYLEQGVERIVDQVVNPKVSSVFIPQVEDLVYNYLGITRKKSSPVITAETSNGKTIAENDLLPTDLEAVSPGSVHDDKDDRDAVNGHDTKMDVDVENTDKENINGNHVEKLERKDEIEENLSKLESDMSVDNITEIPIPSEDIKLEDIPVPDTSPSKIDLNQIVIPEDMKTTDIPIPSDEQIPLPKDEEKEQFFKPVGSDDEGSSSDSSSIRRNMSPLTPIRNFNNENSYDAQQAFDNDSNDTKAEIKEPSTFRFSIENKSNEQSNDAPKTEKKDEQTLSYQFSTQVNLNTFNTPLYDDSSNSNHLQIDYESDVNSKTNLDSKLPDSEQNSRDSKKDKKQDDKKSSHKSSHRSRNSSSKDKKYDSKRSSRDSSRHDKKSSRDESKSKSSDKDKSKEKMDTKENTEKKESRVEVSEKKESKESSDKPKEDKKDYKDSSDKKDRDSSRYKSSHKSSTKDKDSKSHRSSSSNHRHSSKYSDEKKSSSSSQKYRSERNSDKSSKEKSSRDSKSSSHRSDKDRKSSSSSKKSDDKDKEKKSKKDTDDHYSVSGRGNHTRRSTDRDSNDGSSSSKGSQNTSNTKSSDNKKESKSSSSKSGSTTTSSESTSPSEKENIVNDVTDAKNMQQQKPVRVEDHLEMPFASPPRLPFVPDVTLKKPRFAANLQEAKKMIKMRKFLEEEQKRMNQEAALLLEFQANVRPSLSQVYSSIPGPELEFACMQQTNEPMQYSTVVVPLEQIGGQQIEENVVLQVDMKTNEFISEGEVAMESNVEEISVKNEAMMAAEEARHIEETNAIIETLSEDDSINENTNRKSELNAQTSITEAEKQNNIGEGKAESLDDIINEINKDATKKDYNEFENKSIGNEMQSTSDIFDITVITEELSEDEGSNGQKDLIAKEMYRDIIDNCPEESLLKFFAEHEKFNAEMERHKFVKFMKTISEITSKSKMYLVNCNKHTETLFKEVSQAFGDFEIVNYHKNGNLKLHNVTTNVVKDVNISDEITLPVDTGKDFEIRTAHSQIFSPVKSECSFELASDYDAKLEEMVNRTSRQEIMEIILGNVALDESPSKMPRINYCMDSSIESDEENTLKRKYVEVESSVNNNRPVLTPNKIRKHSSSDQISSTTEETLEAPNTKLQNSTRSKYLGRAKRVGLPKPKRCNLPNSPSSDKSVENYEQNAQQTPNGKIKTPRNKIQRYDTSDLYKPKLHFLSRRNNIT